MLLVDVSVDVVVTVVVIVIVIVFVIVLGVLAIALAVVVGIAHFFIFSVEILSMLSAFVCNKHVMYVTVVIVSCSSNLTTLTRLSSYEPRSLVVCCQKAA